MKISQFEYTKKKDGQIGRYTVLVMRDDQEYVEGIEFDKLSHDEQQEVAKIQAEYEKQLYPFVKKAYRKFLKENIQDVTST